MKNIPFLCYQSKATTTATIPCFMFIIFISIHLPSSSALSFSFPFFNSSAYDFILFQNDSFVNYGINLTRSSYGGNLSLSVGRASFKEPFFLHDSTTGEVSDFSTHFSFIINSFNRNYSGDGLAFFLAPFPSVVPENSLGGSLGLVESKNNLNASVNQFVAVEFDTFKNYFDPSNDHVGIDVNSMESAAVVTWNSSMRGGRKANAWISYKASTMNLSVFLTYEDNPVFAGNSSVHHIVDLRKILPEKVSIGFSAATGELYETHNLLSWEFKSTSLYHPQNPGRKSRGSLVAGIAICTTFIFAATGLLCYFRWKKKKVAELNRRKVNEEIDEDYIDDREFEKGQGPRKFFFEDLAAATNDFSSELKLGEGGFGGVYKGFLTDPQLEVAIKRISQTSQQGKKEYISEVKIISRLRHRNLVQLVGWCHERKELLLVYELMPMGSLDSYLYGRDINKMLPWNFRFKIALGLASALLYLHEEWEECVVHRDVKPSNVMLDAGFNAKLGDFGLARFADHERGLQTTILAGTMGYLAPETINSGKASKESDVYSFGVVALELACGRRPIDHKRKEEDEVSLVSWIWDLYGRGEMLSAADERLRFEFDRDEMARLMIVGLWSAHPDKEMRPTIRQAMAALMKEGQLPELPATMPVPMYYAPPRQLSGFSYTSTSTTGISMGSISAGHYYNTTNSEGSSSAITGGSSTASLLMPEMS